MKCNVMQCTNSENILINAFYIPSAYNKIQSKTKTKLCEIKGLYIKKKDRVLWGFFDGFLS